MQPPALLSTATAAGSSCSLTGFTTVAWRRSSNVFSWHKRAATTAGVAFGTRSKKCSAASIMNGTRLNFTKPAQAGWGVADPLVDRIRRTFQGTFLHVLQIRRRQVIKLSQACMQVDFGCVQHGFCKHAQDGLLHGKRMQLFSFMLLRPCPAA